MKWEVVLGHTVFGMKAGDRGGKVVILVKLA
jgi:hypothetical protein